MIFGLDSRVEKRAGLRIWQDDDARKMAWCASLENPHTGERRGFASLRALITFLREQGGIRENEGVLGRRGKRVSLKSPVLANRRFAQNPHAWLCAGVVG